MSDFDSLREDLARALETIQHAGEANVRAWTANVDDHTAIWCDIGELRDEIHALANRIENVTHAKPLGPQSFVCRVNPGCNEQHRAHVHGDDGALIYVPNEEAVDRYYSERDARDRILRRNRG